VARNIPKHAKLAFRGQTVSVYQWRQKMFDGSYETFEAIKRAYTVQMIPVVGDKVAIVHEEQPGVGSWWGLVGGRMDEGEKPAHAARRELLEETGLVPKKLKLLRTFNVPHSQVDWNVYLFLANGCRKVAEQDLDAGEKITVHYVTLDKLLNLNGRLGPDIALYFNEIRNDGKRLQAFKKELFGSGD
jgi:ADP-ribose pyrophosphatase